MSDSTVSLAFLRLAAIEFPIGRIEAFGARFLRRVGEIVTSAYTWAAGGVERVTDAGWRTVAEMVGRQEQYGGSFLDALRRGDLSARQAQARAALYAGGAVEAFERGKAALHGVEDDLPGYPGDGSCEGLGQCRCSWEFSQDGTEATWRAAGDKNTCAPCADRARDWAPWKLS